MAGGVRTTATPSKRSRKSRFLPSSHLITPDPVVEAPAMEDHLEASMVEEGCWEAAVVAAMMGFD